VRDRTWSCVGTGTTAETVGWVLGFVQGGSVIVIALASCGSVGTRECAWRYSVRSSSSNSSVLPPFGLEIRPSSPRPSTESNAPKVFVLLAGDEGPAPGEAVRERSNSVQSKARYEALLDGRWICEGAREEKFVHGMGAIGLDERPSSTSMGGFPLPFPLENASGEWQPLSSESGEVIPVAKLWKLASELTLVLLCGWGVRDRSGIGMAVARRMGEKSKEIDDRGEDE
jgi:hypothetical protein